MSREDSDVDSSVNTDDVPDTEYRTDARAGAEPAGEPPSELAARLSSTVPSRRSYGAERIEGTDSGLLTPRERQYLRHAHRLDDDDRDAVEDVVADRVTEFVDTEWPVIQETCPEAVAALREEICVDED